MTQEYCRTICCILLGYFGPALDHFASSTCLSQGSLYFAAWRKKSCFVSSIFRELILLLLLYPVSNQTLRYGIFGLAVLDICFRPDSPRIPQLETKFRSTVEYLNYKCCTAQHVFTSSVYVFNLNVPDALPCWRFPLGRLIRLSLRGVGMPS